MHPLLLLGGAALAGLGLYEVTKKKSAGGTIQPPPVKKTDGGVVVPPPIPDAKASIDTSSAAYQDGYNAGFTDGYADGAAGTGKNPREDLGYSDDKNKQANYNAGYSVGYNEGYASGAKKIVEDSKDDEATKADLKKKADAQKAQDDADYAKGRADGYSVGSTWGTSDGANCTKGANSSVTGGGAGKSWSYQKGYNDGYVQGYNTGYGSIMTDTQQSYCCKKFYKDNGYTGPGCNPVTSALPYETSETGGVGSLDVFGIEVGVVDNPRYNTALPSANPADVSRAYKSGYEIGWEWFCTGGMVDPSMTPFYRNLTDPDLRESYERGVRDARAACNMKARKSVMRVGEDQAPGWYDQTTYWYNKGFEIGKNPAYNCGTIMQPVGFNSMYQIDKDAYMMGYAAGVAAKGC